MKHHLESWNVRQVLAVSLALIASVVLLLVPMYTQVKLTSGGPEQVSHSTLLETVGWSIVMPLLIPVALPLLLRGRARTPVSVGTTVALVVFVVIGSASVGWFYIPALAAAVAAVVASTGSHARLQVRSN
jgi:Kef-type K+ transport system membrane component KefB